MYLGDLHRGLDWWRGGWRFVLRVTGDERRARVSHKVREPSWGMAHWGKRQQDARTPVMYSAIRQNYCHDRRRLARRISIIGGLGCACKIHQCLYIDASE
jgi:hypothetical protein